MKYTLFYTGPASTPFSIGLKCLTTNEVVNEINVAMSTGKGTRARYNKFRILLEEKFSNIL